MPYKILHLTNKPSFPEIDGGSLEMAKMSRFYNNHPDFDLDILTISTYKHPFLKEDFEKQINSNSQINSVFIKTRPNFIGALVTLIKNKSYNLSRFYDKKFKNKLIEVLSSKEYDFVQCESIYLGQYESIIRNHSKAKIVLNTPNIEHELWETIAKNANPFKRIYLNILASQLKKEEESIWKKMDGVISISENGKNTIYKVNKKVISLPFYLDNTNYQPNYKSEVSNPTFFHLGAMNWIPNVEGIKWFADSVWKEIEEPKQLFIAGKNMPKFLLNHSDKSIHSKGFVEDAKEFMNQFDVMVVPLLSGSGIRVKIIEAMALGKCIISTPLGAEGIEYTDGKNILIAKNKTEFIASIKKLMKNPLLVNEMGKEAKKLAESRYDIANLEKHLIPFLKNMTLSK